MVLLYQSSVTAESILYKATDCLTSREGEVRAGKERGGGGGGGSSNGRPSRASVKMSN